MAEGDRFELPEGSVIPTKITINVGTVNEEVIFEIEDGRIKTDRRDNDLKAEMAAAYEIPE